MAYVIDRRLNGKNKSTVNRQRFLKRYKKHIKKAVSDAVSNRSITDTHSGEKITIPSRDISEPTFRHGQGGKKTNIHPGNKEFSTGDKVPRPKSGAGSGSQGKASDSGEGMDEFAFQISQEEFLEFLFDDLELPNLVRKQLKSIDSYKYVHAGIVSDGVPAKINILRSMKSALGRRIALGGDTRETIRAIEDEITCLESEEPIDQDKVNKLKDQLGGLKNKIAHIPFIDTLDLRYNLTLKEPQPSTAAVMFCLMDVSGSMNQATKDTAKRFFLLLYLFLKKSYTKIEVVFIRHHTSAKEVDEEEFFYSRETGGTIVSSALKLMKEIMDKRYSSDQWNIFAAQASDGDNWNDDSPVCKDILTNQIMPLVQYFTYVEITPRDHQALWHEYELIKSEFPDSFAQQQIVEHSDIYPVFRELFQKKAAII